jgi:hypothetical protein
VVNAQDAEMDEIILIEDEEEALLEAMQHPSWQLCLLALDKDPERAKARMAELQASRKHKEAYKADGEVLLPIMLHI